MNPSSFYSLLAEGILIFIMMICIFYISVFLFFNIDVEYTDYIIIVNQVSLIVFVLDIFKNFITGYYEKGSLVTEIDVIFIHYFRNSLFFDLMPLVPLLF